VRRIILLCVLLAAVIVAVLLWRSSSSHQQSGGASVPTIIKQPENFANRTFDPASPPSDIPPFAPDELAVCDSDFLSDAHVAGEAHETDSTHAIVTVTGVTVNLQLNVTIWVPNTASQHVLDHEQGHREISEHFYMAADKIAAKIAAPYLGRKFEISGADLNVELSKSLREMGAEITAQYGRELNPNPTQLRYDTITDHSRNDVTAKDAVAQALNDNSAALSLPVFKGKLSQSGWSVLLTRERYATASGRPSRICKAHPAVRGVTAASQRIPSKDLRLSRSAQAAFSNSIAPGQIPLAILSL
jgi:hypothetical protein